MKKKDRGFTMLELLVVLGIVGILATVGIPTFRNAAAKSKRAEAKVNLGALYSAEEGFQAEWGSYGNHLVKLGMEEPKMKYYNVGFPDGNCGNKDVFPASNTSFGTRITNEFPSYYPGAGTTVDSVFLTDPPGPQCKDSAINFGSFTATASGAIKPGLDNSAQLSQQDVWSMNEKRILKNEDDGLD